MRFVDPKNVVAFQTIFGDKHHKEVLISFLNAVLELKGDQQIADIQILNPYQAPRLTYFRYTLLDIRAVDKRGVHFIVEMQMEAVDGFKQRFQYYAAKSYSGQIGRGEEYNKLNTVFFIGILDFTAFESKKYLTRHLTQSSLVQGQPGAILAARLSEDSARSVLLLKAGPDFPIFEEMPEEKVAAPSPETCQPTNPALSSQNTATERCFVD